MGEFRMPSLGADMDVGTIIEWLVKPGDAVRRGQIVAVVDTAKAAIEIEAFEEGVVAEILIGTGVKVAVGTPLAMHRGVCGRRRPPTPRSQGARQTPPLSRRRLRRFNRAESTPHGRGRRPGAPPPHPRATPPVRHLAHQLGVDLDAVAGTGPDGHITHDDVLRAAPTPGGRGRSASTAESGSAAHRSRIPDRSGTSIPIDRDRSARWRIDRTGARGAASGDAAGATDRRRARDRPRACPSAARLGGGRARRRRRAGGRVACSGADHRTPSAGGRHGGGHGAHAPSTSCASPAAAFATPGRPGRGATRAGTAAQADKKAAMRTAIANLMSRSNTEIPHYYVSQTIDLGAAMPWLRTHNAALPVAKRVLPAALFLRATVLAAAAVPDLNGHWVDGALRPAERIDLGVAVATRGGGLVTPAIPDAGALRIDDLMAATVRPRRSVPGGATCARPRWPARASPSAASGETGPDALYGVIFPPQVALVGIGGIVERPWAINGMLTVRPTVTVVLAADHRASDGRTASAFLATFAHALQNPEEL